MKLSETFLIEKKDILSKKFNIMIPICLGNKFFVEKNIPTENIIKYISWALNNTCEKVLVIVVDRIQDTNYFVRNHSRTEFASLRRVLKDGNEIKENILDIITLNFPDEQNKIEVIRYDDYQKNDIHWAEITHAVYKEFKNNSKFSEAVLNSVKSSVTDREFSQEEYWRLCDYVLDEFALAYAGINYKNINYGVYIYPEPDAVVRLVENIQKGLIFSNLNKKLTQRRIGLGILND